MQESKLSSNSVVRFITGSVMGLVILGAIIFSPLLCKLILALVAIFMLGEWYDMTSSDRCYLIAGLPIISVPISCLLLITMIPEYRYILITYGVMTSAVDSFAMYGGMTFGGPKLAPALSPRKTWSGLFSGVLASALIVLPLSMIPGYEFPYQGLQLSIFAAIFGVVCQISDLFISFFKRRFHLKDSGDIIPGHGGVLDRFDSMIFSAPLMLYVVI